MWKLLQKQAEPFNRFVRMIHVIPVPALSDNYMYLVMDKKSKDAFVVDPVEPRKLQPVIQKEGANVKAILTTHHHWDHAGGNTEFVRSFKVPVYGGDQRVDALTDVAKHGDTFTIGGMNIRCLSTPCHTSGHICYYLTDSDNNKVVFTGDTMFIAGCGRFFEGDARQMYEALVEKLGALPDDTCVYPGHEYTVQNLKYAAHADPKNELVKAKLNWAQEVTKKGEFTVPSSIGEEKQINPFVRVKENGIHEHTGTSDPIQAMSKLRSEKNSFRS